MQVCRQHGWYSRQFGWLALAVALLPILSGCASWDLPENPAEFRLPMPEVGSNSIVYETAFIRWAGKTDGEEDVLWQEVDEQFLPPDVRHALTSNGLRVGVLSGPLPEAIRNSLEASSDPLAVITDQNAVPGAEVLTKRERRQSPAGALEEIEVLPPNDGTRIVLFNEAGRIRALPFDQPRGFLKLTLEPVADGRMKIELIPVMEYGVPKQRIIGGQNAYRVEVRREREEFANLGVHSILGPGQTLVMTATDEKKGLGGTLFADRFEAEQDRLLLLLRMTETGVDDLFAPHREHEPLVTPLR